MRQTSRHNATHGGAYCLPTLEIRRDAKRRRLELLAVTRDGMENEMTDEPKLWAMHVPGPDDVFAMASEEAAHAAVAEMGLAERFGMTPEQVSARVIEWPHSAESHAESLASGEADVLDTTNGMGIPDSLYTALKSSSDG